MSGALRTKDFAVPLVDGEAGEYLEAYRTKASDSELGTDKCPLGSKTVSGSSKFVLQGQKIELYTVLWKYDASLKKASDYPKSSTAQSMVDLDLKYLFQVIDCENTHIYYAYPAYLLGKASRNRDWFIFNSVWAVAIAAVLFKDELKLDSKKPIAPSALAATVQDLFTKSPVLDGHLVLQSEFFKLNTRKMRNFPFRSFSALKEFLLKKKTSSSSSAAAAAAPKSSSSSKKNPTSDSKEKKKKTTKKKTATENKKKEKKKEGDRSDVGSATSDKEDDVSSSDLIASLLENSTTVLPIVKSRKAIALAAQRLLSSVENDIVTITIDVPLAPSTSSEHILSALSKCCNNEQSVLSEIAAGIYANCKKPVSEDVLAKADKDFEAREQGQLTAEMMAVNAATAEFCRTKKEHDEGFTMTIGEWAACIAAYARTNEKAATFLKQTRERMMSAKKPLFNVLRRGLTYSDLGQNSDDANETKYYFAYLLAAEQAATLVHSQYAEYLAAVSLEIKTHTSLQEKAHAAQLKSMHAAYSNRLKEHKQTMKATVTSKMEEVAVNVKKLEDETRELQEKLTSSKIQIDQLQAELAVLAASKDKAKEEVAVPKRKRSESCSTAEENSSKLSSLKSIFSEENKKSRTTTSSSSETAAVSAKKKDKGKEEALPATAEPPLHAVVDMATGYDSEDSSNYEDAANGDDDDEYEDEESEKTYERSDDEEGSISDEILDESDENASDEDSEDDMF